jgi:hypothetical protein
MSQEKKYRYRLTTEALAGRFGVKAATVRRNYCVNGHFLGLKPIKLSNTRLLWPDTTPEELTKRG